MNGDGFDDVVVADIDTDVPSCDRHMAILRSGGFPSYPHLRDPLSGDQRPWSTSGTFDVAVLDINGDGRLDLWCGTCDGNRIFINTTEPGQGGIPTVLWVTIPGDSFRLLCRRLADDGLVAIPAMDRSLPDTF